MFLFEVRKQTNTSSHNKYCQKFKYKIMPKYLILNLALNEKFFDGCVFTYLPTILGFMKYQKLSFS